MAAKVALFTLLAGNEDVDKTNQNTICLISSRLISKMMCYFFSVLLLLLYLFLLFLCHLPINFDDWMWENEDDLKHVVGSETTRYGLLNSFSMWQHKTLNKRLVLVLFNELLTTLYQTDDLTKHVKWAVSTDVDYFLWNSTSWKQLSG